MTDATPKGPYEPVPKGRRLTVADLAATHAVCRECRHKKPTRDMVQDRHRKRGYQMLCRVCHGILNAKRKALRHAE